MDYVDGFVTAVPTKNKDLYLQHITPVAQMFKDHGALKYVECWGEDVRTGEKTSFPQAVQCQPDETVVFSWIVWPSRQVRDEGIAAVMAEYEALRDSNPMPFDASRVIFGGFDVIIDV